MTLYADIKTQIAETIEDSLSEFQNPIVLFANRSASEPPISYCTISRMSLRQTARPQYNGLDVGLNTQVIIPYEISCSVNFIGSIAGDMAFSSHARLGSFRPNRELSQSYNLSVKNKSLVSPTPYKRDTKWVDVFSYDVTFTMLWGITYEEQPVNQVIIENSDYSEIITIPPEI